MYFVWDTRDGFSDTPIKGALSNNSFQGFLHMKIKEALQGLQAEKKIGNYSHDGISRPSRGTGMTSLRYEYDRTLSLTRRLTTWTYYNFDGRTRPIQNFKKEHKLWPKYDDTHPRRLVQCAKLIMWLNNDSITEVCRVKCPLSFVKLP